MKKHHMMTDTRFHIKKFKIKICKFSLNVTVKQKHSCLDTQLILSVK